MVSCLPVTSTYTAGITFFARITPSAKSPFPNAAAASSAAFAAANMSPALPNDADLALSLESLRGRKFLQVRGVTAVEDEEYDSGDSVQVYVTGCPYCSPQLTSGLSHRRS